MKKILLMMFISLMLLCEATINGGMAQEPPIKAGLTLDKEWYNLNEPIQATLTLTNSVSTPIITSKGFADSYFHLYLVFTDPDGKVITSDQLQNIRPFAPPPPRAIKLQGGWGQAEPIEFLAINNSEGKWCLSMNFNIRDYYSSDYFSKAGKYSVKAMVPMRTYLNYESIANVNYADIKSENWKGFIESNIEHFTISGETPGTIDVFAELNKVTGRNRSKKTPIVGMTVKIYDKTSFCVLQYGINWQNYSPDIWGNCSSLASGSTDQYGKVSFPLQAWDYIVIGHYTEIPPEEFPGLSAGGLGSGDIMQKYLLVVR